MAEDKETKNSGKPVRRPEQRPTKNAERQPAPSPDPVAAAAQQKHDRAGRRAGRKDKYKHALGQCGKACKWAASRNSMMVAFNALLVVVGFLEIRLLNRQNTQMVTQSEQMVEQSGLMAGQLRAMSDQNAEMVKQTKASQGQWEATNKQYRAMIEANNVAKIAADAAKAAADAAKASNEIARENAQRQLRAYVNIDTMGIFHGNKNISTVILKLKNFGQTPAADMRVITKFKYTTPPHAEPSGTILVENATTSHFNLAAGAIMQHTAEMTIGPNDMALLLRDDKRLWMVGEIRYRDCFGNDRVSRFREFAFVGDDPEDGTRGLHLFMTGHEGNEEE